MSDELLILSALLIGVTVFAGRLVAGRMGVPEAIVLVALGAAAGFVPGLSEIRFPPDVILLVFLPPLIYSAAFFSSPRDIRAEARPIIALAVVMTLVTAFAIAGMVWLVLPDTGWPAAIALGAAVAPTDAVASAAVLKRVGAPKRVVTLLEGESLINDGVALTLFSLAVTAMSTPLSVGAGALELGKVVVGGIVWGTAVAVGTAWFRRRLRDANSQLVLSLMVPFVAYVPADTAGFSGVLAAVVAGFYLGTRVEGMLPPKVRVTGQTVWRGLVMILESVLFVLLGLQLHAVFEAVAGLSWVRLALGGAAVLGTAVLVRLAWEMLVPPLVRLVGPGGSGDPGSLSPRERFVIGWCGMRGAISLAIALSLPRTLDGGYFVDRDVLLYFAAVVVLGTLVGQGATLPLVLRWTGLAGGEDTRREYAVAEEAMGRAALSRLDELASDEKVDERAAERHRQMLKLQVREARAVLGEDETARSRVSRRVRGDLFLRQELARAQREALNRLYRDGSIGHETLQAVRRRLDLREPPGHVDPP
ncbi:Na+/H+ antiporter [Nocardiopsis chromatogenes]|uniref:Na+/H+ antiporter n=1 Tax=Nocardiopsis chromatogenes TaxID=280239 RepID=UPI000346FF86|nr:Na+/H+ antiporter [Nocardiopsis chromatogenes]